MMDCISVENMRQSDAYTIAKLVPSLELMHWAAYGVFQAVTRKYRKQDSFAALHGWIWA